MASMLALVLETSALGAEPPPTEIALARRLFADARTAEESKDWPTAASKLRDAISIKETSGLRFHLAYCEEQQGMLVEALIDYERAEDLSADKNDDFRAQIPARRTALQKRIPTVTLLFSRDPASAHLTIDGRSVASASLGKPIPLNPGKHAFVVSTPGFVPFNTELSLSEGDAIVTNVVLTLESNGDAVSTLPTPPAGPPGSPGGGMGTGRVRTYVLVGEGALTLGALTLGIVYTLEGRADDEEAKNAKLRLPGATAEEKRYACSPPVKSPVVCADLAAAQDDGPRHRFIARLGFIGAGVGAAAFASTLVLWPTRRPQTTIRPWLGQGVAGLSVVGGF